MSSPSCSPLPDIADEAVDISNVTPCHVLQGASANDLRNELMRHRYRAIYFAGHGDADLSRTIAFTNPTGGLQSMQAEDVTKLLGAHSPEVVVLNGCHSERLGELVRQAGVPYVVCWRTRTHNAAARTLASSFFASLAAGRDHVQAFDDARHAVRLVTRPGRLASGVASLVPAYELREDGELMASEDTEGTEAACMETFLPRPMAVGIPILLCAADRAVDGVCVTALSLDGATPCVLGQPLLEHHATDAAKEETKKEPVAGVPTLASMDGPIVMAPPPLTRTGGPRFAAPPPLTRTDGPGFYVPPSASAACSMDY